MTETKPAEVRRHGTEAPSDWVQRWSHLLKPGGTVLDVACGFGRHARWFYERNHAVVVVDRAPEAIAFIANSIQVEPSQTLETVVADIENGPWPFDERRFDAIVVTHYLWRPLFPVLLDSLAVGGVLIYETFAEGNETVGKPSRSDFLLRHGELLDACKGLRIVAYEDGFQDGAEGSLPRFIQRIAAVREPEDTVPRQGDMPLKSQAPVRYRLT